MKIYLAVPIIANRELKKAETISKIIINLGHELVSSWVINATPDFSLSASFVFERDFQGVRSCDLLIAEVSKGSHGVGMEIMVAHIYKKKIILLYEENSKLSYMLQGVPNTVLLKYSSLENMVAKLKSVLQELNNPLKDTSKKV